MELHIYIHNDNAESEQLTRIENLVKQLVSDPETLKLLAEKLGTSTNELKEAIDKNTINQ